MIGGERPVSSETVRNVPTGPLRKGPTGIEPARIVAGQPGGAKGPVVMEADTARIDARHIYYKTLNEQIREQIEAGAHTVILDNVNGQRYIGAGLTGDGVTLVVNGVPGNDLATFMDGPTVIVNDNAQDGIGNTMNRGLVVVNGDAGDVLGYGMRGGRLYVRGDVGYRVGIHMKAYKEARPVIIAGGRARDFFGEYMAGGELILLGLGESEEAIVGSYVGTGMHGGLIFLRGAVEQHQLGKEVAVTTPDAADAARLADVVGDFCRVMGLDIGEVMSVPFVKLFPYSSRPYGKLYAY
jgi:glutamate synthase domain-containing protein 3